MRIAIIGTGPGGLATAESVLKCGEPVQVVVYEKGRLPRARICPVDAGKACRGCGQICNVTSGFGGCLQYGDAVKLSRYPSGRRIAALLGDAYETLERDAMTFLGTMPEDFTAGAKVAGCDLPIRTYPVAEISESRLSSLVLSKFSTISGCSDIRMRTRVREVRRARGGFVVSSTCNAERFDDQFDAVVIAVGRSGLGDLSEWLDANQVSRMPGTVSLGVRFELPSNLLRPLYAIHKDFKVSERGGSPKVKTFCFSAHPIAGGTLKYCHYQDQFPSSVVFVDGHSRIELPAAESQSVGNFALLAQVDSAGASGLRWLNSTFLPAYQAVAGGRPIWQPLAELIGESTRRAFPRPSVPDLRRGSIEQLVPPNILKALLDSYKAIAWLAADLGNIDRRSYVDDTLVVAPSVEFVWDTVDVSSGFETNVPDLFVLGDCAGLSQGIVQAAISGLAAGRELQVRARKHQSSFRPLRRFVSTMS